MLGFHSTSVLLKVLPRGKPHAQLLWGCYKMSTRHLGPKHLYLIRRQGFTDTIVKVVTM